MKIVAKYNICKSVSTLLTLGTPIATLCSCSELFVHRSESAISAAGMFTLLVMALLFKDKIAENFKMPSAFIVCAAGLILVLVLEEILLPMKYVCIATMCTTGIDELTFKRFYKNIEEKLPTEAMRYKHFGFLFTSSNALSGGKHG